MSPILFGSCSWKYDSWQGLVYQNLPKSKDNDDLENSYLAQYAEQYDTVEIDQWFWSLFKSDQPVLPASKVVAAYAKSIPAHFRFTVKVPNSITLTHHYSRDKQEPLQANPHFLSVDLFQEFLKILSPLFPFLGPLIFQFEYLNRQKMPSLVSFLARLEDFFKSVDRTFPLVIETRNQNYLKTGYFNLLQKQGLGHVLMQGYWMPPITEVMTAHRDFFKTQSVQVIRLHGTDRGEIEKKTHKKWNKIVEPKKEEMISIMRAIQDTFEPKIPIYVNVNNHYEGSAPLTIAQLKKILGK